MVYDLIIQVTKVAHKCQPTHCGTEIIDFAACCFYEGSSPYSTAILKEKVSQNIQYSLKGLSLTGFVGFFDSESALFSTLSTREEDVTSFFVSVSIASNKRVTEVPYSVSDSAVCSVH